MTENVIRELALTARGIPDDGESHPTQEQIWEAKTTLETSIRKESILIHSGPCKLVGLNLGNLEYLTLSSGQQLEGQYLAYDTGVV